MKIMMMVLDYSNDTEQRVRVTARTLALRILVATIEVAE